MLNSVRDYDTLGFARFLREVFIYFLDVVSEPARLPKAKAPCMTPGITAGVGSVSVNDLCPPASSVSSFKHPGRYLSFFPPALHRSVLRVLSWTEREKKKLVLLEGKGCHLKKNNRVAECSFRFNSEGAPLFNYACWGDFGSYIWLWNYVDVRHKTP